MKNILLIISIILSFTFSTLASNIGDGLTSLVSNENLELSVETTNEKFILFSTVDSQKETVQFIFENTVTMISVFNADGELEMILPVDSDKVYLGLSLFSSGKYKLGFMLVGSDEMLLTNLEIK